MSPRRQRGEGSVFKRASVSSHSWCRLTFRHRGQVGYILSSGPYWMCDNCGQVVR